MQRRGDDWGQGREPIERLVQPLRDFAHHKLAGATLLLLATVVAIAWANSPWADGYRNLLATPIRVGVGEWQLEKPLLLWVNDGLMGVFFFVVGLEIKRELLAGELASLRKAALPIAGALGGIVVPAALYALINPQPPAADGWGVPMATDIAFALGVLALLGSRVPIGLKVFLTALAIVDDIAAIVVIAVFYTEQIAVHSLLIGGALLVVSIAANALGARSPLLFFLIGTCVWLAFLESGVHATLASVLMAMTIPARTRISGELFAARMDDLLTGLRATDLGRGRKLLAPHQQNLLMEIENTAGHWSAPLQQLEHQLMPLVTVLVLPTFALANAGVALGSGALEAAGHPVALGVVAGLFVGKQLGIFGFAWAAVRLGLADLPLGVGWRQLHAAAVLGGIGFTMSLFLGGLAFPGDPALQERAKVGILLASLVSAVAGLLLLRAALDRRDAAAGGGS